MKRLLPLALLLVGILVPFDALARSSTTWTAALRWAFGTLTSHVVMHTALFASLALCVMALSSGKPRRRAAVIALMVVVCVSMGQEAIQAISRGAWPVSDTLLDLGVDMAGGGIGVMLGLAVDQRRAATQSGGG